MSLLKRVEEWLLNDAEKPHKEYVYEECLHCGFKRTTTDGLTVFARKGDTEFCNRCYKIKKVSSFP